MATPLAAALAKASGARPAYMIPVTVTSVSPLMVSLGAGAPVHGVEVAGLTYSLGAAVAFIFDGGAPLVIPTAT